MDGFDVMGSLVGTFLSPYIFAWLSYYGCYGINLGLEFISVCYLIFVIKYVIHFDFISFQENLSQRIWRKEKSAAVI